MSFLIIGDIHGRVKTPISRKDNIEEVLTEKFKQIKKLIDKKNILAVVTTGDLLDKARVSNETLIFMRDLIHSLEIPFLTIVGNHDMIGNSIENHSVSSLALLEEITENLKVLDDVETFFTPDGEQVNFFANHYGCESYSIETLSGYNIIIAHDMITETEQMFDSTCYSDIQTNADLIICGHNHNKLEKAMIYNPGALLRLSAAKEDREREVEVGILSFAFESISIEPVFLEIGSVDDVFSISEIEDKQEMLSETMSKILDQKLGEISSIRDILNSVLGSIEYVEEDLEELKKYIEI